MSKDTLGYLIECKCECEWLDYKVQLSFGTDREICNFTRDVLAIKNVGGGYLVIGVEDKSWKPVGLDSHIMLDSKQLRDKVVKASGVTVDVDIVHHEIQYANSTCLFALILVRSTKKKSKLKRPTLACKDFCSRDNFGIRQGDIYARKGDSTVKISSQADFEDLLDYLEQKVQEQEFELTNKQSCFAIEDGLYRLMDRGFDKFIGRFSLREKLLESIMKDPRLWIINIHGPGGVGKSALANWAIYELYEKRLFDCIIHLSAKDRMLTPDGIASCSPSLYSLENLLDHIIDTFGETIPHDLNKRKELAIEWLTAGSTLLVLDNMESVNDGRIMEFVTGLPAETKVKVLMTSRQRSGGWELPFPVQELTIDETNEFLQLRCKELSVNFTDLSRFVSDIWNCTGGLPLALQWLLGRYKIQKGIKKILDSFSGKDCPVLEYSFRNIWLLLSQDSRIILSVLTIFDKFPTAQLISITTGFPIDRVENALNELEDVTLVNKFTQVSDGKIIYTALPITLTFARHQLTLMGEGSLQFTQRYQRYLSQIQLDETEMSNFNSTFSKYAIESDDEKRAVILCRRGESEYFMGNYDNADSLFKEALDLIPQSSYVNALRASYELTRNNIARAQYFIAEAIKRITPATGALCYVIKSKILEVEHRWDDRIACLKKATEFDPNDNVVRHQYGVALSKNGKSEDAINEFNHIISKESKKDIPSKQLMLALKTRMLNYNRLGMLEKLEDDKKMVLGFIDQFPHLSEEIEYFSEFLSS